MKRNRVLLLIAIILFACTLRAPITGVGTLIHMIQAELSLSHSAAGFVTTIPLIAFAVVSPFVSRISERFGQGRTVVLGLSILLIGLAVRSYMRRGGFFAGTALIGIGIAFGNVLLPSIIKASYPLRVGLMTGIYTTCQTIFAGIAPGISVPLTEHTGRGWADVLSLWMPLVALALVSWLFQWNMGRSVKAPASERAKEPSILKSPMTWWVSCFMGTQSLLFYSFVAWLPAVLQSKGISAQAAGYYATLFQWIGIPASFFVSILAGKVKNQRLLCGFASVLYGVGLLLLPFGKSTAVLMTGVLICGLCAGAMLGLAMCIISFRSRDARQAAKLSGTAQAFGYALAAVSPTLLGALYDLFSDWTPPLMFLVVMAGVLLVSGVKAGRARYI